MTKFSISRLLLLLLFAVPESVYSAGADSSPRYSFKQITRENGLSILSVECSMQDSRGFMWFGTTLGLNFYDGRTIRNFIPHYSGTSVSADAVVNSIVETNDGRLWLATANGCCVFDYDTGEFTPYVCDRPEYGGSFFDMAIDKDGSVWAINGNGLFRINLHDGTTSFFGNKGKVRYNDVLCTKRGDIWVASRSGSLYRYRKESCDFRRYDVLTAEEQTSNVKLGPIAENPTGDIIVSTLYHGARLFSPLSGKARILFGSFGEDSNTRINSILARKDGEIWFGTENGIYIYNDGIRCHITKGYDSNSLTDNAIHSLFEDRDAGVWVGTFFGGVCYLPNISRDFVTTMATNASGDIVANVIREIIPAEDGGLWVGTEDGGLFFYDTRLRSLEERVLEWNDMPVSKNIQSFLMFGKNLLIGTQNEGLYVYDTKKKCVTDHVIIDTCTTSRLNFIVKLHDLGNGRLLIGTMSGLLSYDLNSREIKSVKNMDGKFIHYIYKTRNETILAATIQNGLYQITYDGSSYKSRKMNTSYNDLTTLFEDSRGNLWIGTNTHGLFTYDISTQTMTSANTCFSSSDIAIYKIMEDADGILWITTSDGLYRLDIENGNVIRYGLQNSLPTDQFNFNSGYQDNSGNFYLGSLKGLVTFNRNSLHNSRRYYDVYFTDYSKDASSFSLNLSVPLFSSSQSLWFRYRLEGLDTDWIISRGASTIKYANLNPGKYTFVVEATNINGLWSGHCSRMEIEIEHNPFLSPLAMTIYVLIVAILGTYLGINRRRRMLEHRQHRIQKMRSEIEKEALNDKIKFFTDITHEIRTPLSLITGCLERIRKREVIESPSADKDVVVLNHNRERLLNLTIQLLDFRKMEVSSYAMYFDNVDLKPVVRGIYESFTPAMSERGIQCQLFIPNEDCMVVADKEAVIKIITNMISNAMKYCDKVVSVCLGCTEPDKAEVFVKVSNDGTLIPEGERQNVFKPFYQVYKEGANTTINGTGIGLSLSLKLAELQNGRFEYDTSDDKNNFIFTLSNTCNEQSEALDSDRTTILVVDDEFELRQFISEDLAEQYNVIQAPNGKIALDIIEDQTVSLIVTDIMMPVMNGIELCKAIKEDMRFCHIPVIVLTAKVSLNDHLEALESKSDEYIEKPFHTKVLISQINNLLANRKLLCTSYLQSPYSITDNVATNNLDKQFLDRLNQYVIESIHDENLTIELLAERMNMSTSTLYRKVKQLTSVSPQEFVKCCKLKKAAELLARGNMPIKQVAEETGFSSTTYFTTCFMKQFGITPGKFKRSEK